MSADPLLTEMPVFRFMGLTPDELRDAIAFARYHGWHALASETTDAGHESLHVSLSRAYREGRRAVWNELIEHAEDGIRASSEPLLANVESSDIPEAALSSSGSIDAERPNWRDATPEQWDAARDALNDAAHFDAMLIERYPNQRDNYVAYIVAKARSESVE